MSSSESERVRFSGDLIGERGDRSLTARILASISSLALAVFVRPVSEFVVDSSVNSVL